MIKKLVITVLFIVSVGFALNTNKYVYIEHINYQYIDYLINQGSFLPHSVFQQPYKLSELPVSCRTENWAYLFGDKRISFLADYDNSYTVNSTGNHHLFALTLGGHYCNDDLILGNRFTLNKKYKYDPFFAGDLSESEDWLYGRVNDAYADITVNRFNFFIGRMKKNWGPVNSYGLIRSSHPYSYDHVDINYRTDFFRFSLLYSRLEDAGRGREFMGKDSTYNEFTDVTKHIMGHRVDVHFSDKFQIALTEMAIYGGQDREFELAFANPMTFYYGVQRNEGKGMSGLWCVDVFYKPASKVTLYGQFLIDDIIVNNDPGVNDRGRYPDRFALMFSIRSGDLLMKGLNTDLSYVKVWNDTYQSRRTWENYHYEGLGFGYPAVACEEMQLKLGYWNFYPLFISNEFIFGRYGDAEITDIFLLQKREFPARPVHSNIYNKFSLHYRPKNYLKIYLNYEFVQKGGHYLNRLDFLDKHNIEMGLDLLFVKGFFY
ncbi:MAG: hypothetical protein JXQ65_10130 [Candidatus Marinimicrobia bacterium]|nr:hypothetical protein [Candidatus Neomarinimicrobiota bacterium]